MIKGTAFCWRVKLSSSTGVSGRRWGSWQGHAKVKKGSHNKVGVVTKRIGAFQVHAEDKKLIGVILIKKRKQ